MFTGIIETTGVIRSLKDQDFWIDAGFSHELKKGQSVAVNGVCLTVVDNDRQGFKVNSHDETKRLTNLSDLKAGDLVNLERAMKAEDRFDGHIVQGHVEGVGSVSSLGMVGSLGDKKMQLKVPRKLTKYMIPKGIIILDGIALTLTKVDDKKAEIEVAIIAYTWENTNLHTKKVGAIINIETDLIARYLERFVPPQ